MSSLFMDVELGQEVLETPLGALVYPNDELCERVIDFATEHDAATVGDFLGIALGGDDGDGDNQGEGYDPPDGLDGDILRAFAEGLAQATIGITYELPEEDEEAGA